jgi:PAS domain S-box-containing protein
MKGGIFIDSRQMLQETRPEDTCESGGPCRRLMEMAASEQKRVEERLHLDSVVFENLSSGLMVIDANGIVQSVNPAFTLITGYPPEDILGQEMNQLFCSLYNCDTAEMIKSALNTRGRCRSEVWTTRKNGEKYLQGFTVKAISRDWGEIEHYINIFQDITEHEELKKERQLLREQKNRMHRLTSLSALSAGIVHEIAQPLNIIKLLSDTMLYMYHEDGLFRQDEIIANLEKISNQADRVYALINQMRSFTNAAHPAENLPCSLNNAVKKIIDVLGRQLSAHGIVLTTELQEDLPEILGTINGYEEIVLNLLTNSMQALDLVDDGREKEIAIRTCLEDGRICLEVSDNATGISEEIKADIFEPLFSTKKSGEGMGLGLTIVQAIVQRFNGSIDVRNNARGGATFTLSFLAAGQGE